MVTEFLTNKFRKTNKIPYYSRIKLESYANYWDYLSDFAIHLLNILLLESQSHNMHALISFFVSVSILVPS